MHPLPLTERPATAQDYDRYARLFLELATGDPVTPRDLWEADMLPDAFFLEHQGVPVGYGYGVVMDEVAYVREVIVDPGWRRRGVGHAIMAAFARRFRARGCRRWCLNVKPDNLPAVHLYQSFGLETAYASAVIRLAWRVVAQLPAEQTPFTAHLIQPDEDPALESAFALPPGQLASRRAQRGWRLVRLVDPAQPDDPHVGLACFNPRFPRAFPFRVVRPMLARALLEGLRPHALPEYDYVQAVVEGDPALRQLLAESGGEVRLEFLHMAGALPA